MRSRDFLTENHHTKKDIFIEMFKKFLPLAMEIIELKDLPRMVFIRSIKDTDQPTFGRYVNDEKTLYVALANRHPNDILRTIAHELTHYKQDTDHKLDSTSGATGSPEENEANSLAGIVMRYFNKQYPEYLKVRPVILEKWSTKYKRSINCSNPKGFSQRAHCQGRKKNEDIESTEEGRKKKKRKTVRYAAYGPGPYGWYGYYPGYSGDSGSEGGADGGVGENYFSKNVEPDEPGYQHDILTMPANTLVIDTPGELDWYKIGQHFPNLDKEDPHEYGQSESDMVINFANKSEMLKFAKVATRLGFKIKSIGGGVEHPEIHSELREKLNRTSSKELVIFDIDDTLLHTTAKIAVRKNGKVIRTLTNQEFNNYKLGPDEEFDFGEFRDASKFEEESVPIGPMLDRLRSDLASGKNVVMLTARADFDNQKAVWRTFKRHGIDINRDVHLFRAGNLPGSESPSVKKAIHVSKWLGTGDYSKIVMYDDSEKNLAVFKSLEKRFPNVEFEAHHVSEKGETTQVENFADGRNPQDKGDSRRYSIPKKASLATLDKIGKGSGRKAQLARWQANMRRGRKK